MSTTYPPRIQICGGLSVIIIFSFEPKQQKTKKHPFMPNISQLNVEEE